MSDKYQLKAVIDAVGKLPLVRARIPRNIFAMTAPVAALVPASALVAAKNAAKHFQKMPACKGAGITQVHK